MKQFSKYVLILCYFLMFYMSSFFYPKWEQSGTEATISWDVSGYYMYLPAIFIYHDIKHCQFQEQVLKQYKPTPDFQQAFLHQASGNYVMKYACGQAILMSPYFFLADFICNHITKHPPDGFSRPYQICIALGMLLYGMIGLFFLRKILLEYFEDKTVAIVLLAYVFGTNYLNYSSIDQGLTHSSLFSIYCILIYVTISFYKKPNILKSLAIGVLVGLATLIRPTDIIALLIPLFWNISSVENIKQRISFFKKNISLLIYATIPFLLVAGIQPLYWKYASGEWLVYSYQDQGFSWLNPHIKKFCWSYRCGWLRYTPMMFFAIIGMYFLFKRKISSWLIIAFILIDFYIVCSWDIWDYGASSGRAMIQCYPLLAFPLATFIEKINERKLTTIIFYPLFLLCIYLNLWWVYNLHKNGVLVTDLTKEYYWQVLGRWNTDDFDIQLLDNKDSYQAYPQKFDVMYQNDFEKDTSLNRKSIRNNQLIVVNEQKQYSQEYFIPVSPKIKKWIRASADIHCDSIEYNGMIRCQFNIFFYQGETIIQSNFIRPHRFLKAGETKNLFLDAEVPTGKYTKIGLQFWNAGGTKEVRIDNLKLITFDE